jgi:hypothetical protein
VRSQYLNTGQCVFVTGGIGKLELALLVAAIMPEICSCGAQLPPDSLFCHKCGKPQREIVEPEPVAPVNVPVAFVPHAAAVPVQRVVAPVSFRNPVALRIALLVGVIATVLMGYLPLVNWLAAGFFTVLWYRRKTHNLLNVGAGLHLGWITGLVMFTMWGVFFMALGLTGKLTAILQDSLKSMPSNSDPNLQQMAQFMGSGPGLMVVLAGGFVFITCLSMAGGALGAKIMGRD